MAPKHWLFMQIEPQPARGTLREEMWDSPDWIAEEKMDGDRRIAQFCGKVVRFTGRRKSVKDQLFVEKSANVPHLSAFHPGPRPDEVPGPHKPPAALEGTVLDGEMIVTYDGKQGSTTWAKGGESKFVTSIMGSLPEEAVAKQIERGWLRYVVFDCLWYKGKDIRSYDLFRRWAFALKAVEEWGNPFVSVSKQYGEVRDADKRAYYDKIVARGGEGVILKRLDSKYGDRQAWVKKKKEATADVVIMGFVPAKEMSKKVNGEKSITKYAAAGLIGAIQCGQYPTGDVKGGTQGYRAGALVEVATVSGMDDALRAEITKHPKKFLGRVLEIEHNGREPTGRFRHPRFGRWRDDKDPKDCIYREEET